MVPSVVLRDVTDHRSTPVEPSNILIARSFPAGPPNPSTTKERPSADAAAAKTCRWKAPISATGSHGLLRGLLAGRGHRGELLGREEGQDRHLGSGGVLGQQEVLLGVERLELALPGK
jgi:hypothetical protein